jgi:hypothetical protein
MKLLAGRTHDLADVEAILASGADRELLWAAVRKAAPSHLEILERLIDEPYVPPPAPPAAAERSPAGGHTCGSRAAAGRPS